MFRSILLLSIFCLWAAEGGKKLPVCEEQYLMYEFTTNEPVHVVKERFKHVDVVYKFKVFGVGHYIFIVRNDESMALKNLKLPEDSLQSLQCYMPVESLDTFYSRLDIPRLKMNIIPDPLPDGNLTFIERIWKIPENINEEEYKALMTEHRKQVKANKFDLPSALFVAAGAFPTKFLYFWNENDCTNAELLFENSDSLGGPSNVEIHIRRIYNL